MGFAADSITVSEDQLVQSAGIAGTAKLTATVRTDPRTAAELINAAPPYVSWSESNDPGVNVTMVNLGSTAVMITAISSTPAHYHMTFNAVIHYPCSGGGELTINESTTLIYTAVQVTMLTQNVQLVQSPGLNSVEITAQVTPNDYTLQWQAASCDGNPYVNYTYEAGGSGRSTMTVTLGNITQWTNDATAGFVAVCNECLNAVAHCLIPMKKFRRDGQTAPGSLPMVFDLSSSASGLLTSYTCAAPTTCTSTASLINVLGTHQDPKANSGSLIVSYSPGSDDTGDGTYEVQTDVNFNGSYDQWGIYTSGSDRSTVSVAGAAGGTVTRNSVTTAVDMSPAGAGYAVAQDPVEMDLGLELCKEPGLTIGVKCTLIDVGNFQDRPSIQGVDHIHIVNLDNPRGHAVSETWSVDTATNAEVTQSNGTQFDVQGTSSLSASAGGSADNVVLSFTPKL